MRIAHKQDATANKKKIIRPHERNSCLNINVKIPNPAFFIIVSILSNIPVNFVYNIY